MMSNSDGNDVERSAGVVVPEAAVSWSGPISPTFLANFSRGRSRIESVYGI